MANPLLLSTDIGSDVDDALSLLAMVHHPAIDLHAVYTVNGDVDSRSYIARHITNLAGRSDIVVARGIADPLGAPVKPYSLFEEAYVDSSFEDKKEMERRSGYDICFKDLARVRIVPDGITDLHQRLARGNYAVFSIGPLTNLAAILRDEPGMAAHIKHLYIMGACFPEGTMEHNFRYDTVAAQEVLAADVPITIVPSDVCSRYQMPVKLEKIVSERILGETAASRYVDRMLRSAVGHKLVARFRNTFINGRHLFDVLRDTIKQTSWVDVQKVEKAQKLEIDFTNPHHLNEELASYAPSIFWSDFNAYVTQLRDPKLSYFAGSTTAEFLESLVPKAITIHDVYIPYVFLYPERVETAPMTISCDDRGQTRILPGHKHQVVVNLDYEHFARFVEEFVR